MKHLLETIDGAIFEISTMYDKNACRTQYIHEAVSCVIWLGGDDWKALEISKIQGRIYQLH